MRVLVVQNVKGGCFQQQGHDFAVMHAAHGMMQDVAPVHIPDVEVHSYMSSTDVGEANRGFFCTSTLGQAQSLHHIHVAFQRRQHERSAAFAVPSTP